MICVRPFIHSSYTDILSTWRWFRSYNPVMSALDLHVSGADTKAKELPTRRSAVAASWVGEWKRPFGLEQTPQKRGEVPKWLFLTGCLSSGCLHSKGTIIWGLYYSPVTFGNSQE